MKTKIKEREDGSRYHVWDAEQSTPAMVAFGVNWGITFFMIITGEMSRAWACSPSPSPRWWYFRC
jgi:hypothetical protein